MVRNGCRGPRTAGYRNSFFPPFQSESSLNRVNRHGLPLVLSYPFGNELRRRILPAQLPFSMRSVKRFNKSNHFPIDCRHAKGPERLRHQLLPAKCAEIVAMVPPIYAQDTVSNPVKERHGRIPLLSAIWKGNRGDIFREARDRPARKPAISNAQRRSG